MMTPKGLQGLCFNPTFPWIGNTVDTSGADCGGKPCPAVCAGVLSVPSPFNEILTFAVPAGLLFLLMRGRR